VGRSTPWLSASGPSSGKALINQLLTERLAISHEYPKIATVLVGLAITRSPDFKRSCVQQLQKPERCSVAELLFIIALRVRHLRGVDVRNPYLRTCQPHCVAIDDAVVAHCNAYLELVLDWWGRFGRSLNERRFSRYFERR